MTAVSDPAATQATQTQTQESDAFASYAASFDADHVFARFVSLCNQDKVPTIVIPRRAPGYVYKFGRHHSCDFILPGNRFSNVHFKVWEEMAGAEHARRPGVSSVIMLQDCSTNGTFFNQARMGKGESIVLANGDEIAAGLGVARDEVRFVVQLPASSRGVEPAGGLPSGGAVVGTSGGGKSGSARPGFSAEAERCMQKYKIGNLLGSGAFAEVKECIDRTNGTRYAVKILNQRKLAITSASAKAAELFKREIEILQSTRHPNIVQYVDMWHDDRDIFLVLEYCSGGDLMDYIIKRGRLSDYESVQIVQQILSALVYCHRIGIAHRDIKPENILLTSSEPPVCKLTDFGLAKMVEPGSFLKTFCGTLTYVAPEVISMHGRVQGAYSTSVDMWSVGCVAFICVAGSMPFTAPENQGQEGMMRVIQKGAFDVAALHQLKVSPHCLDFIEQCLQTDPAKRITGEQALRHPWITEAEYRRASGDEAEGAQAHQGGGWHGEDLMEESAMFRSPAPKGNHLNPQGQNGISTNSPFGFDKSPFRVPEPRPAKENRPPGGNPAVLDKEATITPLKKPAPSASPLGAALPPTSRFSSEDTASPSANAATTIPSVGALERDDTMLPNCAWVPAGISTADFASEGEDDDEDDDGDDSFGRPNYRGGLVLGSSRYDESAFHLGPGPIPTDSTHQNANATTTGYVTAPLASKSMIARIANITSTTALKRPLSSDGGVEMSDNHAQGQSEAKRPRA
ncbi:Protein kinase protein rad53 [Savitreella phatthalungensis]